MLGYYDVFRDKRRTELRTVHFKDDTEPSLKSNEATIPAGIFGFAEYYCTELSCDCQRVLINAFYAPQPDAVATVVATINYSWHENPDDLWRAATADMPNPFLDPLHRQAAYAPQLLEFWHSMVCKDQRYAERLKNHYEELRQLHGQRKPALAAEVPAMKLAIDPAERKRRQRELRKLQEKRRHGPRRK